jgi:uncharacterized protein (DUF433 family)
MNDDFDWRARITIDPDVQAGVPVVKGRRVPLSVLVSLMAAGHTEDEAAATYLVTQEDVRAALTFASVLFQQQGLAIPPEEEYRAEDGWVTLA